MKFTMRKNKTWGSSRQLSEMDPAPAQVEDWCLVDGEGERYKLPKTMLFMGREECDIVVRSETVDKRHAVITFDHYLNKFKIKDLTTANGTFVNDRRIHDQEYVTLEHMDSVRLGQDSMMYHMEEVREDEDQQAPEQDVAQPTTNMPSWATKELPLMAMAECQGCIAEQRISHTCTVQSDQSDVMNFSPNHCVVRPDQSDAMHYTHHQHVVHNNQSEAMHYNPQNHVIYTEQTEAINYIPHPHMINTDQPHYNPQHVMHMDQSHYSGHQQQMYPDNSHYDNVESYTNEEYKPQNSSKQSDKDLGCNTWPRKRMRNVRNIASFFTEELTNGTSQDDHSHRILRGESTQRENLPPELETVKKATPLYGQPDWWGEDVDPNDNTEDASNLSVDSKGHQQYVTNTLNNSHRMEPAQGEASHDTSVLDPRDVPPSKSHDPGGGGPTADESHDKGDNPIPRPPSDSSAGPAMSFTVDFDEDIRTMNSAGKLSDFVPSKMRKSFRERKEKAIAKAKEANSPEKLASSSVAKDISPAAKGGKSVSKAGTPEKEDLPEKIEAEEIATKRQKKAEAEMTPPRLRKKVENEEMTPRRQKKIDEIWESDSSSSTKGRRSTEMKRSSRSSQESDNVSVPTRLTRSMDTDKVTTRSSRSMDTDKVTTRSSRSVDTDKVTTRSSRSVDTDKVTTRSSRSMNTEKVSTRSTRSMDMDKVTTRSPRSMDMDKVNTRSTRSQDTEKVTAVSARGTKTYVKRKVTTDPKKSQKSAQLKEEDQTAAAAVLKMTESASYLIDKMFESSPSKPGTKTKSKTMADRFTEHTMYREAKEYDNEKFKLTLDTDNSAPLLDLMTPTKEGSEEELKEVDEAVDNVSEAGTYTIDCDDVDEEEQQARHSIDTVFGVASDADMMSQSLVINDEGKKRLDELRIDEPLEDKFAKGEITLADLEKEIGRLERRKTEVSVSSSVEGEGGSSALQELRIIEDHENPSTSLPSDAPAWVTQWAALTNQKSRSRSSNMDASSPSSIHSHTSEKDEKTFKKSAHGLRRRGTGRKLPSIPGESSKTSPSSSEHSSRVSETTGSPSILTPRHSDGVFLENGRPKAVTISSQVVSKYDDTDTESVSRTKFSSDTESVATSALTSVTRSDMDTDRPSRSSRSVSIESDRTTHSSRSARSTGSMDTELLLRDTETVMAAMEARMGSKSSNKPKEPPQMNGANDSFSDNESMVAMVNGDDQYVKPTNFSSPRQNLAKTRPTTGQVKNKPSLIRTNSATARLNAFRVCNKRHSSGDVSTVVSDVLSETPTEIEPTEDSFSRSNSKGKGKMTMTRPNRAFELRRARAEADEPTTPGSTVSSVSDTSSRGTTSTTNSSRPSSKSRLYSDRTNDSARSDLSLGGQIVARSRNNTTRSTSDLLRRDGGRHSLRLNRANSSTDPVSTLGTDIRKTDIKSIKARLKNSTYGTTGLSVTGVSSSSRSSTNTQTSNSRTNSPKSAEKEAWRRRKEYDPRKSVATAAKAKSQGKKSKGDEIRILASKNSKMTRSASFTNTAELRRYRRDNSSLSSTDEISTCTNSEVDHSFVDPSSQRGFIPYSGRSQSSRLYQSSEDEEMNMMVKSSQDLSRCLLGSVPYMSAFTPPPPKLMSPSSSPSPLPLSLFKPRPYNHTAPSRKYSEPTLPVVQSYDNILVSSIFQLSLKLKSSTDKSLKKLKDHERIENGTAVSPMDEMLDQASNVSGDMPGWNSANQELAGILNNLRKIEHHVHVMNKVLFPDEESDSDTPRMTGQEKQEYLQEIERIRGELAGFQPISTPEEAWKFRDGDESIESDCEELGVPEEFF
ncbi:centrosomal protein of 170 kDa-like isoform X3 [Mizuhopecten yessoensis]|uniref:centrosomal protein of 170 kDa-like isoform X3 n=1 Tax=Mizuhopecten yessoensis TaxID=6573 RepID=UPI000B45DDDF|nr:centrosomal protein of 170 kDa-like isoform X3 [Mizuhopecten yessoensis]